MLNSAILAAVVSKARNRGVLSFEKVEGGVEDEKKKGDEGRDEACSWLEGDWGVHCACSSVVNVFFCWSDSLGVVGWKSSWPPSDFVRFRLILKLFEVQLPPLLNSPSDDGELQIFSTVFTPLCYTSSFDIDPFFPPDSSSPAPTSLAPVPHRRRSWEVPQPQGFGDGIGEVAGGCPDTAE